MEPSKAMVPHDERLGPRAQSTGSKPLQLLDTQSYKLIMPAEVYYIFCRANFVQAYFIVDQVSSCRTQRP